jgi:hypothetical protein
MLPMGLEGEGRSLSLGTKLKADRAPHKGRDPFHLEEEGTHGILEIVDARTSSNSGARTSGENCGNNTGTTWGGEQPS